MTEQWLSAASAGRWWLPGDDSLSQAWTLPGFDDSTWAFSSAADASGASLEVLDVNANYNDPGNWQASLLAGGTPGSPAIIRPAFRSVVQDGAQILLQFQAAAGQSYTVYWSDNIVAGHWQVLATLPAGAGTRLEEVSDDLAPAAAQRFYRLATP